MDEEVAYRGMLKVWENLIITATKSTLIMTITKAPASATESLFSIVQCNGVIVLNLLWSFHGLSYSFTDTKLAR